MSDGSRGIGNPTFIIRHRCFCLRHHEMDYSNRNTDSLRDERELDKWWSLYSVNGTSQTISDERKWHELLFSLNLCRSSSLSRHLVRMTCSNVGQGRVIYGKKKDVMEPIVDISINGDFYESIRKMTDIFQRE